MDFFLISYSLNQINYLNVFDFESPLLSGIKITTLKMEHFKTYSGIVSKPLVLCPPNWFNLETI